MIKEGRYWEEPEKRICKLCGGEEESWEHVWERCRRWEEWGWELAGGDKMGAGGGRRGRGMDEKDGERKEGDGKGEEGNWRRGVRVVSGGGLR